MPNSVELQLKTVHTFCRSLTRIKSSKFEIMSRGSSTCAISLPPDIERSQRFPHKESWKKKETETDSDIILDILEKISQHLNDLQELYNALRSILGIIRFTQF